MAYYPEPPPPPPATRGAVSVRHQGCVLNNADSGGNSGAAWLGAARRGSVPAQARLAIWSASAWDSGARGR